MKKFGAGDGFFAQWVVNASFLLVGFVVFAAHNFEPFYPLAMIGGACWATGNMMSIPIISRLGMCLGILIWNAVNCVVGFVVTFVGLFGIEAKPTSMPVLSFIGLGAVLVGGVLFGFVENCPDDKECKNEQCPIPLNVSTESGSDSQNDQEKPAQDNKCKPKQRI
ncbi:Protein W02D3.4, partial [Aphelenchoides avenae]